MAPLPLLFLLFISAVDPSSSSHLRRPLPHHPARPLRLVSRPPHAFRHALADKNSTKPTNSSSASNSTAPSPAPPAHRWNRRSRVRIWILGFLGGSIAGVASGFAITVLFRLLLNYIRGRCRPDRSGPSIFVPQIIKRAEDLAFLEKDDGLAALAVIGRGGCGEVFKAEHAGSPGRFLAIKQILKRATNPADHLTEEESRQLDKWMRQTRSEIVTAGHVRHRNLLPLVAHVPRPDYHLLVYEYMRNGSLRDVLLAVAGGRRELDWPARHRIAVGIAAGLEYLHVSHRPQIIHRDLKPANILLDDDMEPRIADFGLAKMMPGDSRTHVTASHIAGTFGYIAPEYHQTLKFTAKCDVFSFGVILAALATGRQPTDEFFQSTAEVNMVKWVRNRMRSEDPATAFDPALAGRGFDGQVLLVLRIACFCTADDPKERPSSKDVRCMLSQIKS